MPYRPIYRDFDVVPACPSPAWRRRGVSFAEARGLEQRHQPPLPARVAVNIALRHLDRPMPGEQLADDKLRRLNDSLIQRRPTGLKYAKLFTIFRRPR